MLNDTSIIHTDGEPKGVSNTSTDDVSNMIPHPDDEVVDDSSMSTKDNADNPSPSKNNFKSIRRALIRAIGIAHPQNFICTMVIDEHDRQNKLKITGPEGEWPAEGHNKLMLDELISESQVYPTEGAAAAYQVLKVLEVQHTDNSGDVTRDNESTDQLGDVFTVDMDQRDRILSTFAARAQIMGKIIDMKPENIIDGFVLFMSLSQLKVFGGDVYRAFAREPTNLLQTRDPITGVIGAGSIVRTNNTRTETQFIFVCVYVGQDGELKAIVYNPHTGNIVYDVGVPSISSLPNATKPTQKQYDQLAAAFKAWVKTKTSPTTAITATLRRSSRVVKPTQQFQITDVPSTSSQEPSQPPPKQKRPDDSKEKPENKKRRERYRRNKEQKALREKQADFDATVKEEAKKLAEDNQRMKLQEEAARNREEAARNRENADKQTNELLAKVQLLEQQLAREQQLRKFPVQEHTNFSAPGNHQARHENAPHEDREPANKPYNAAHCITPSPDQPHQYPRGTDQTRSMTENLRDLFGATRGVYAHSFFRFFLPRCPRSSLSTKSLIFAFR